MENQRPRGGYNYNGAVQDDSQDDEVRKQRLLALQLEALGSSRRHTITTQGYKEDLKLETTSLMAIEKARRINKRGTTESQITDDVKNGLTRWKTAWVQLENDGTAENSLSSMNDGQTHREKLMSDPTVKDYQEDSDDFTDALPGRSGGYDRSRGGGRGGRGGGRAGARPTRHGPARIPAGMPALLSSVPGKAFKESARSLGIYKENATKPIKKATGQQVNVEAKSSSPSKSTGPRPKPSPSKVDEILPIRAAEKAPRELNSANGTYLAPPDAFMAAAKKQFKLSSDKKTDTKPPTQVQAPSHVAPTQCANPGAFNQEENENPADIRKTDAFRASARRILNLSSSKTAAPSPSGSSQLSSKNSSAESADIKSSGEMAGTGSAGVRTNEAGSTVLRELTPLPFKTSGQSQNFQAHREADPTAAGSSPPAVREALSSANSYEHEPQPALAQLLAEHRGTMPPALFAQLQSYLTAQAKAVAPQQPKATIIATSPKIVVNIPKSVAVSEGSTTTQVHAMDANATNDETTFQATLPSYGNTPSQDLSKTTDFSQASESAKPTILGSRPTKPLMPAQARTSHVVNVVRTKPNIYGEHVIQSKPHILGEHIVKDRYAAFTTPETPSVIDSEEPFSPSSVDFTQLSLREESQPSAVRNSINLADVRITGPGDSRDITAPKAPAPFPTEEGYQPGLVQARLAARVTPKLVNSAVARQYTPSPPSTKSPTEYATKNPFAQLSPKTHSEVPSRVDDHQEEKYPSQTLLSERSRASSQATSTGTAPTPTHRELPQSSKRFPTAPYDSKERGSASKLELPAFLKNLQPNKDVAASARAQYGGMGPTSDIKMENAKDHHVAAAPAMRNGNSRLQLPAFLDGLQPHHYTATAARAQHGEVSTNANTLGQGTAGNMNRKASQPAKIPESEHAVAAPSQSIIAAMSPVASLR